MAATIKRYEKHLADILADILDEESPVKAAPYWLLYEVHPYDFASDKELDAFVQRITDRRFTLDEALEICRRNGVDI